MVELIEHEDFGDEEVVALKKCTSPEGWSITCKNVSVWVESRLCEEGIELMTCHLTTKWTIETIDEVLVDYKDEDTGYHIHQGLVSITRKKVEIEQGGLCTGCGLRKHMQFDHVNETPRDWRRSNLQCLCAGYHQKVPIITVSLFLTCALLTSTYRKRISTRMQRVSSCTLTLLPLPLKVASFLIPLACLVRAGRLDLCV